jgi:hypothetical protein
MSAKGVRQGGRKKGTPNKRSLAAAERLIEMGYDPLEALVLVASGRMKFETIVKYPTQDGKGTFEMVEEVAAPVEQRVRCMIELATYVYPKRRSIEYEPAPPPNGNDDVDLTLLPSNELRLVYNAIKTATPEPNTD